jgi:hypothetical protein
MKLKRKLVNDKYKALIDSMYAKEPLTLSFDSARTPAHRA